jgi:ABC-type polysaccharide transport system permease subunit
MEKTTYSKTIKLMRNHWQMYALLLAPLIWLFVFKYYPMLNTVSAQGYKKFIQTVICLPYFISIVVMMGILFHIFNPIAGIYGFGRIMSLGFEKIYLMQNSLNLGRSEVISTYVYKAGLAVGGGDFSYATAVGLFSVCPQSRLLYGRNADFSPMHLLSFCAKTVRKMRF